MNPRTKLSLGLSALVMGGSLVGCTANSGGLASAGSRDGAAAARIAAKDAGRAQAALAKGNAVIAVSQAEAAVALMPQNAGYRALLGNSYLKAGRFIAARAVFTEALALDSTDGRSALSLALAQIALGDWQAARATLDTHTALISPTDRGLALALAGDPTGGAELLTMVVRSGQATPKARQNLALALALAGQWQGARIVASTDMSPADVDRRMEQWAAFAKPQSSADQVAALLGVRPVPDIGRPVALALAAAVPVGAPVAGTSAAEPTALQAMTVTDPVPPVPVPAAAAVDVALAREAMMPIPKARSAPAPLLRAESRAIKVPLARPPALVRSPAPARSPASTKGNYYVQVGAYSNAGIAQNGWRQATRRMPALARNVPTTARFAAEKGDVYRLAFGGFAHREAMAVCRRYRANGGACFVRAAAGDQIASWAAKPIQLASR